MSKIIIDASKVTSEIAEQLIKICPFQAFDYTNSILSINANCRICKQCIKKGPLGVCTLETEEIKLINKSEWKGIAVFIEHRGHKIHNVSIELIGKAIELAKVVDHPVYAVMIGHDNHKMIEELLSYGIDYVISYDHSLLSDFNVERYANALSDFIDHFKPSTVLYGGTTLGRSLAPKLAARYHTGLTADCTVLDIKKNTDLIQIRPAYGGNILASIITPNHRPQMATVRYKIFPMPEKTTIKGVVIKRDMEKISLASTIEILNQKIKETQIDISEASIIIACGRPFKTKESLKPVYELAKLLKGSVAVTRPLIEAGLVDPRLQIGLSGRTVAPKLIINLGISGSVQYMAGMTGAERIITVNSDASAPIFQISHVGIIGDVFKILPLLIEKIQKGQNLAEAL
jgi:electron transfer flavoprotein alpha subunit